MSLGSAGRLAPAARRAALLGLLFALGCAIACSSSNQAKPDRLCTPGAYVYCRCEDRSEGTKLCHDDGQGFDPCACDGSGTFDDPPPPTGGDDGGLETIDSGPPVGPQIEAACANKLGVVAGDDEDTYTYVMTYAGNGVFNAAKGHPGIRSAPAIVPVGSSLIAAYEGAYSAVLWTKLTSGTWSAPFSVGSASVAGPVSIVAYAGGARLFYRGTDDAYHVGVYGVSGWDDATAAAGPDAGITADSSPAAAALSSSIVLTVASIDGTLQRTTYSSSGWSVVGKFTSATALGSPPVVTALDPGGAKDLLVVYEGKDSLLHFVTRDSTTHDWGSPGLVDSAAITAGEHASEMSIASMAGGKAMLVWRASNAAGYFSVWDPGAGWGAPKELLAGVPELASSPSITRGRCGSDATVAYAKKAGGVELLRYTSGSWSGPFAVGGVVKATYVGVGELP